ncbi:hypothetical protein [Marinicrinis lubricantis]|uniref:Uncharacterized protein n=1 Tax=Marinicrinis lubricantis TaxID=2086470 RepID=A0ABW1IQH1_9BACL
MKLFQVRKGQFVYFNNELYKVYGVKPMMKLSVHLIRLRDLTQHLTKSANVEKYKPKERDSFIFNHKVYTLSLNRRAEVGDMIFIHNPIPDSLDTYSLNDIELVEEVDKYGVVTSNSHGIKHNEYMLMIPGRAHDSHPIDFQNPDHAAVENLEDTESHIHLSNDELLPKLGDVYKQKDSDHVFEAMVVAIQGQTVYLGGHLEVPQYELMDTDKWEFLYNLLDI